MKGQNWTTAVFMLLLKIISSKEDIRVRVWSRVMGAEGRIGNLMSKGKKHLV